MCLRSFIILSLRGRLFHNCIMRRNIRYSRMYVRPSVCLSDAGLQVGAAESEPGEQRSKSEPGEKNECRVLNTQK